MPSQSQASYHCLGLPKPMRQGSEPMYGPGCGSIDHLILRLWRSVIHTEQNDENMDRGALPCTKFFFVVELLKMS